MCTTKRSSLDTIDVNLCVAAVYFLSGAKIFIFIIIILQNDKSSAEVKEIYLYLYSVPPCYIYSIQCPFAHRGPL